METETTGPFKNKQLKEPHVFMLSHVPKKKTNKNNGPFGEVSGVIPIEL